MITSLQLLMELRRVIPAPYKESEFPRPSHIGACGPEACCDTVCMDISYMSKYNHVLKMVDDFLDKRP